MRTLEPETIGGHRARQVRHLPGDGLLIAVVLALELMLLATAAVATKSRWPRGVIAGTGAADV